MPTNSPKNLYEYQTYFKLIIDGVPTYINEPTGWDKVVITCERDPDFFGVQYEFIDADLSVGFAADDVGYELINNLLLLKGQDGAIIFEFGIIENYIEEIQFTGNVNLNDYVDKDNVLTATIERTDFDSLYRTRFETAITLTAEKTLDGATMAPAAFQTVKLHSKAINKLFKAEVTTPANATTDPVNISRFFSIQLDTANEVTSEITESEGLPLGISAIDPRDEDRYFFKIDEAGDYTLNVTGKFDFTMKRIDSVSVGDYAARPRFMIRRAGVTIVDNDYTAFEKSGTIPGPIGSTSFDFTFSWSGTLNVDDQLFLDVFGQTEHAGGTYAYYVNNYTSSITLAAQTIAPATNCQMCTLYNAITKMLEATTGRQNALISKFLEPGGCGGMYYITNGYQIRNFDIANKPVIDNLKRAIIAISGIEGLGVGITNIGGLDYLVIEPLSNFYQNREILRIISATPVTVNSIDEFEYSEANAKEFVFNEYEVGYNKYAEEDLNTLDEFNTYQNGLFPIKTYKAKFSKKVDYITSGYSWEIQRREQFKTNPSESLSNDDDIFLASCINGESGIEIERDQNFINISNLLSPSTSYNLRFRPKRFLYNWAPYLNIMLWAKGGTDVIHPTLVKDNNLMTAQMVNQCLRYGPTGITQEDADINIDDFKGDNRTRLHLPINANFKCPLKYRDALTLRNASIGKDNDPLSYGYIVHPDDKGNYWKSFVYSFKYTPTTEVAEFKVAKIEKVNFVPLPAYSKIILNVTELESPFVDANGMVKINGIEAETINSTGTTEIDTIPGKTITAIAFSEEEPAADVPLIEMIITDDIGNVYYNNNVPAIPGALMSKDFVTSNLRTYTINIRSYNGS